MNREEELVQTVVELRRTLQQVYMMLDRCVVTAEVPSKAVFLEIKKALAESDIHPHAAVNVNVNSRYPLCELLGVKPYLGSYYTCVVDAAELEKQLEVGPLFDILHARAAMAAARMGSSSET